MSNRNRGAVFRKLLQALLDPAFTFVIQCAGSFIQDQDRRIFKEYPCNRNPLLLSAGKSGASFAYISVISIRQFHDKIMDACTFGGFDDLIVSSTWFSIGNIIFNGSIKKINILLHHTDLASKAFQSQPTDILSIYSNGTAGHIIKSWQKRADRGFSASGRSHQGNGSSSRDIDRNIGKYRSLIIAVMERNMIVTYMTFHILKFHSIIGIFDLRFRFHHIQETTETGKAFLHHFHKFHQDLDRADEDSDIQGIHGKIPGLHFTLGDQITTVNQSHQIHHTLEKQVGAHETTHTVVIITLGNKECFVALFKFFPLNVLICKRLHHADSGKGILKTGIHIADLTPVFHEGFLHFCILAEGKNEHHDHQDDQRQCQLFVDKEQEDKSADDLYQGDKKILRSMMGKLGNVKKVTDQLTHHLAGIVPAVIGKGQLLIMVKKLPAHVTLHVCAHHMSLIGHIIFAETLDDVHDKKGDPDHGKGMENDILILRKKSFCHGTKDLGIGKIHQTDNGRTDQINKKDRFVRTIVVDEFLDGIHRKSTSVFYEMCGLTASKTLLSDSLCSS